MGVPPDFIITIQHVRGAKLCTGGGRDWCKSKGIDWNAFLTNGIPAERLIALKDPFADRVLAAAERMAADGQ